MKEQRIIIYEAYWATLILANIFKDKTGSFVMLILAGILLFHYTYSIIKQ